MTDPVNELNAAAMRLIPPGAYLRVSPAIAAPLAEMLAEVADLHEPKLRGHGGLIPPGCQWCEDEDWPCADTRRALAVARAVLGQQPRETGCAGAGEPHRASDGSTDADTAPSASQSRSAVPAEPCGQKAGVVVLPHPPHKFMRNARLYQCPGHATPDTIEIINPRNTGWYWHCTRCDAEAGKFTAESSARAAARTEHPQCPPDPDGPYAWTIPADQPDPDLNSLRQEIYTRLNREAEFVGCPSATTDDIVRLVRAWHEPSWDSHDASVNSHDASVDSTDAHYFADTRKVIKDAEPAPDCNARDEPDSHHNPDLCTPTCWRQRAPDGLRAQYAEAVSRDWHLDQQVVDEITAAVLAVRDREMQQLRADCQQLSDQADEWCTRAQQAATRLQHARDAAALHRKQLIITAELYAAIEATPEPDQPPGPAATQATEPRHCPCNGTHHPSDTNCRWCKCHRTPEPAAWTPPPPGDTREQLPPHILALIRPYLRGYTSTACQTAGYLAEAIAARPEHRDELTAWRQRMRDRCRDNQKYTGEICPLHTPKEQP